LNDIPDDALDMKSEISHFTNKVEPKTEVRIDLVDTTKRPDRKGWREVFGGFGDMPPDDVTYYTELLDEFSDILATSSDDFRMLKTNLKLDIETTGGSFQLPEYPVNPTLAIFARKLMNTACEQGHFERVSTSRYASPAFVILNPGQEVKEMYADILQRTKNGETDFADIDPGKVVRVVSDMRRLNSITKVQTGTIVTLPEVMAQLQSNTVFSAFDLKHMF